MNDSCITFVGDIYAPGAFRSQLALTPPWVCNLEGPVTKVRVGTTGKINLKTETFNLRENLGSLPAAVSLANNHILDYGDTGMLDTLHVLESAGVQAFGFRAAQGTAATPAHIRCAGLDVVLLGYVCPSTHAACGTEYSPLLMDDELIKNDIRQAKRGGADRVVLCLHWGQEEVPLPTPRDRLRARAYAEVGADLIIGHHSHCIQSWETIDGTPVFYGLGNLVMPDLREPTAFKPDGTPAAWHSKKEHGWNRTSLVVEWAPVRSDWCVRTALFRKGVLTPGGSLSQRRALREPAGDSYACAYARAVRTSGLKVACMSFLTRPRIPTRRQLSTGISMILGRNPRLRARP